VEAISPEDNGLRRRLRGRFTNNFFGVDGLPVEIVNMFLNIQPRPTHIELLQVTNPYHLSHDPREGWHIGLVPDPDRPGYDRYDPDEYKKLIEQEQAKRLKLMIQIIRSRGVECDNQVPVDKSPIRSGAYR
jgi:hypothetical protein